MPALRIISFPITIFRGVPYHRLRIINLSLTSVGQIAQTTLSGTVKDDLGNPLKRGIAISKGVGLSKGQNDVIMINSLADGTFSTTVNGGPTDEFFVQVLGSPGEDCPSFHKIKGTPIT